MSTVKQSLPRCPRCRGKMILDEETGDSACFTCGNVVYATTPTNWATQRVISHAGQNLT